MSDSAIRPVSRQPLPDTAKKVFSGVIFDVYQWDQLQYDGSVKVFEKLKRADTVLVIPITTDGQLLFVEEEQPGKKPFIGFVGGRSEEGENPEEAGRRELLEETGYMCESLTLVEAEQPFSKVEWALYTYIARGCRKVSEQTLDAGEKISLKLLSFDEAVEQMARDDYAEKGSILARLALRAQYSEEKREELRRILFGTI